MTIETGEKCFINIFSGKSNRSLALHLAFVFPSMWSTILRVFDNFLWYANWMFVARARGCYGAFGAKRYRQFDMKKMWKYFVSTPKTILSSSNKPSAMQMCSAKENFEWSTRRTMNSSRSHKFSPHHRAILTANKHTKINWTKRTNK